MLLTGEGCSATCRRSNGYFIYATVEGVSFQPRDVPIGPLEVSLVSTSKGSIHVVTDAASCWGRQNCWLIACSLPGYAIVGMACRELEISFRAWKKLLWA